MNAPPTFLATAIAEVQSIRAELQGLESNVTGEQA